MGNKSIQRLFKPYIVKRKNGQCQVLIPLVELDELCDKIEELLEAKEYGKEPLEPEYDYPAPPPARKGPAGRQAEKERHSQRGRA